MTPVPEVTPAKQADPLIRSPSPSEMNPPKPDGMTPEAEERMISNLEALQRQVRACSLTLEARQRSGAMRKKVAASKIARRLGKIWRPMYAFRKEERQKRRLLVANLVMFLPLFVLAWDTLNIACVLIIRHFAEDEQQCKLQSSVSDVSENTRLGVSLGYYALTIDCFFLGCKPVATTITWVMCQTVSAKYNAWTAAAWQAFTAIDRNESAPQQDDIYSDKEQEPSFTWLALFWQCLFQRQESL